MNLSQVLTEALPELPPQQLSDRPPRIHPRLIAKEHMERGGLFVRAIIPGVAPYFFRFTELQWQLVELFDGRRSYPQIIQEYRRSTGSSVTETSVREFVEALDKQSFWYRTPQEESAILAHELAEERHQAITRRKGSRRDSVVIELFYFNPSKALNWLYPKVKWLYSPWFFAWSLVMIAVMLVILGSRFNTLWDDTVYFYSLTSQGVSHVFEFFGMFLLLGAMHEFAHGLSCHHYGGQSHRMGFFLVYLAPGVFCDAAEAFVVASRWGRIVTIAAGIWSEIVLCSYMSVVWWLTPPGSPVHNFAYMVILSGGILAVLFNWNPLSRMDGYFIFCEIFRFFDLKGSSTAYVVSLVRKYIFRLPAKVKPMPPLRRVGFTLYALLSGLYCYSLLLALVRITYRIMLYYSPLWAFLPATLLGLRIFKSRILKLAHFCKEVYLDKREVMRKHWKPIVAGTVAVVLLVSVPILRDSIEEPFLLEPVQRVVIRAAVPGRVAQIAVDEGQVVNAGSMVARLEDFGLESEAAKVAADYEVAAARARTAQLRYADYATAEQQRLEMARTYAVVHDKAGNLDISSPISGIVTTPRVHDLLGSYVAAGTRIADVADLSRMRARVFVPEMEFHKLETVQSNSIRLNGSWHSLHGTVVGISPTNLEVDAGLIPPEKYRGTRAPNYFAVDIVVANENHQLRDGMTGTAKIYGRPRSVLGLLLRPVVGAVARRLW